MSKALSRSTLDSFTCFKLCYVQLTVAVTCTVPTGCDNRCDAVCSTVDVHVGTIINEHVFDRREVAPFPRSAITFHRAAADAGSRSLRPQPTAALPNAPGRRRRAHQRQHPRWVVAVWSWKTPPRAAKRRYRSCQQVALPAWSVR